MDESFYGILTVLILFTICMLLSFLVMFLKGKYTPKRANKRVEQKIFYVTAPEKPKRKPKNKVTIPVNATIIKAEDLKKFLNED